MKKEEKAQIIDAISQDLSSYSNVYVTDISGLTVEKVNVLRRVCFNKGVKLKVVKNTLLTLAMKQQSDVDYSGLYSELKGSSAIMLSNEANLPARLIKEFRKKEIKPIMKVAFVQSETYVGDDKVDFLCHIKSKEELIGDIITLLRSPMNNLVSALQGGGNKLTGIVKTLSERK